MKISMSSNYFCDNFGDKGAIDKYIEAGFDTLDFSFFASRYYTDELSDEYFVELKKYADDKGLSFNQAHAPFPSSVPDAEKTEEIFHQITTAMKRASILGVPNIVVHPCQHLDYDTDGVPEQLFEINMAFYKKLVPYCEEYGIKVAVENMWQRPRAISHSTCSRPAEFLKYMEALSNDCFVACLDIGHAELVREKPDELIRTLGNKYLGCLHVHDVDGIVDSHTTPFFGIINWEKVTKALGEIDYKGDLTFEAGNFYQRKPKELLVPAARYMHETGKYLVNKIEEYRK